MKSIKMSLAAALAAMAAASGANAGALDEIITNPKLDIEIRPRYEYVDIDGVKDEANAFTVRTAVGVNMGLFGIDGLNAQLQGIDVTNFGWINDYSYPADKKSKYPVVADGPQARMTQANISYTVNGLTLLGGRKMVVLDNARFIGNVGWRQMPQTYDLGAAIYNGIENLSLLGAYVWKVHTVHTGSASRFDTGSVLLHATYKVMPELTLTAYDYMIEDFADHIGIRATGTVSADDVKVKYEAEYAVQNDPTIEDKTDNLDQDSDYYKVAVDVIWNGLTVGAGYEVLGDKGDGALPFTTPLATLHAMNGWADVFLHTPAEGLDDLSVKLAYNMGEYGKLIGVYHSFTSDKDNAAGDDDLGSEVDAAYKYKIAKGLGLLVKGAWYTAGDDSFKKRDTTKYWVQLDYKFSASY